MGAIAKGFVLGFLTAAPGHLFGLVEVGLHRSHAGVEAFVGAVAEGLFERLSAGAPEIVTGLHVLDERGVLLGAHKASLDGLKLTLILLPAPPLGKSLSCG